MQNIELSNGGSLEGKNLNVMPLKDWLAEGEKLFGKDKKTWKFKCCNCGHIQTVNDFLELKKLGIIKQDIDVGSMVYFSCIGRFDTRIPEKDVGTIWNKKSPCNYTCGGLFVFAKLFVIGEDGKHHPVFEFVKEPCSAGDMNDSTCH